MTVMCDTQVLQAEYNRRVGIERGQHEIVCEPIRQRNAERHEVAARRREQRRHIEKANDDLVVAAEQLHQQKLYEVCLTALCCCAVLCRAVLYCAVAITQLEQLQCWLLRNKGLC